MSQVSLVIYGSRNVYPSRAVIQSALLGLLDLHVEDISEILCGMAKGADECGRKFAVHHKIPVIEMPANWDLGKHAGFLRNRAMAARADFGLGFWKGESSGTANMTAHLAALQKTVALIGDS